MNERQLLDQALSAARDTRFATVDPGARHRVAQVFEKAFGSERAVVVADQNTFRAAGRDVCDSLQSGIEPFIFGPHVYAEWACVEELEAALAPVAAIPVAVGSGTINDLTKLAAHRLGRPYMTVATAASMDGYTAYGASITHLGSKQTFDCPAPRAVVADLEVIAGAPAGMNASGFADLLAKNAAGADWILAAAAGVEAIHEPSWNTVQSRLREWLAGSLPQLVYGLLMGGFAMQAYRSSRPASGAEHQFSHLWDMQHHTYRGVAPSHGFKVGIGTLASLKLYESLLERDLGSLDVECCVRQWPALEVLEARIAELLGDGDLAAVAQQEMRAKYIDGDALRTQLTTLHDGWPALRARLREHLLSYAEARDMLVNAGCPVEPEDIGISQERLRLSYRQAYFIRRRFTVLDLAERIGFDCGADPLVRAGPPGPAAGADEGVGRGPGGPPHNSQGALA